MKAIIAALREVVGLFVEDGEYTLAILVWASVIAALTRIRRDAAWLAPLFFLGLAGILLASVCRAAAAKAQDSRRR